MKIGEKIRKEKKVLRRHTLFLVDFFKKEEREYLGRLIFNSLRD